MFLLDTEGIFEIEQEDFCYYKHISIFLFSKRKAASYLNLLPLDMQNVFGINRGKTSCHLTLDMQHSLHRILLLIFLLTIPMVIVVLILMFIFLLLLIMINCVMRALSSGLSEGWSRSPAPTRIAGTLPKMQWLHVGFLYFLEFCTFVFAMVWTMHSWKCNDCTLDLCTFPLCICVLLHFPTFWNIVLLYLQWSGKCTPENAVLAVFCNALHSLHGNALKVLTFQKWCGGFWCNAMWAWLHDPWIRTIPPKAERGDPTFETLPKAKTRHNESSAISHQSDKNGLQSLKNKTFCYFSQFLSDPGKPGVRSLGPDVTNKQTDVV